jgi:hypothetical protein
MLLHWPDFIDWYPVCGFRPPSIRPASNVRIGEVLIIERLDLLENRRPHHRTVAKYQFGAHCHSKDPAFCLGRSFQVLSRFFQVAAISPNKLKSKFFKRFKSAYLLGNWFPRIRGGNGL